MKHLLVLGVLVFSGGALGREISCEENCQVFDPFANQCIYRTSCVLTGNCVTRKYCDVWDSFSQTCTSEAEATVCHQPEPWVPMPSCTASCQYFDTFENHCDYKTQCLYQGRCLTFVSCEKWDAFDRRCLSESKKLICR